MSSPGSSEHFIPVRRSELVELLCADPGLSEDECERFRQFCKLAVAIYHHRYIQILEKLKAAYAPFDPDSDCRAIKKHNGDERLQRQNELFSEFGWLMDRANFRHLSRAELEKSLNTSSHWGLVMEVDFRMFERLAIFARGDAADRRPLRRASGFWRHENIDVPIYRRLVMVMKLKPHKRLNQGISTEGVYMQVFKNIPQQDILMLLPGARARMRALDRGKIGLPILSGLALALWNIADDVLGFLFRYAANPLPLFWGLATGAIGYGARSYFSYVGTRQRYNLNLKEVLYFQNLDTNAGVLLRVIDEAEEQECREAILAYFFLWRQAGEQGWTSHQLQETVERELRGRCEVHVNFEHDDALQKLENLGVLEKVGDRDRALPVEQALNAMEAAWEACFKHHAAPPKATAAVKS